MGCHSLLSLPGPQRYNSSSTQYPEYIYLPSLYKHQLRYLPTYLPTPYTATKRLPPLSYINLHTTMMPRIVSLLIFLLLQITTTIAHPLSKRKGGGGGRSGGGGGGGTGLSSGSLSWKTVLVIVGSILGTFLLLYIIFWQCVPGGRMFDWVKKVRDQRLEKKWAKYEVKDANASANEGQGGN